METIRRAAIACCAGILLVLSGPAAHAQAAPALLGTWKEQQLDFQYTGFTAQYTCNGLREKMLDVLREMGARPGYTVDYLYCSDPFNRAERFPTVRMKFAALMPLAEGAAGKSAGTVAGAWKAVDLVGINKLDPEECELMEHVSKQVLPLFAVRNLVQDTRCVPHQQAAHSVLRMEVFAPLPAAK